MGMWPGPMFRGTPGSVQTLFCFEILMKLTQEPHFSLLHWAPEVTSPVPSGCHRSRLDRQAAEHPPHPC